MKDFSLYDAACRIGYNMFRRNRGTYICQFENLVYLKKNLCQNWTKHELDGPSHPGLSLRYEFNKK